MIAHDVRVLACSLVLGVTIPTLATMRAPAQETPSGPSTFQLPEIEIAGKRPRLASSTPAAVSVISADEIAAMGTLTVADTLRVLPELLVKDSGGGGSRATVSIRGEASTRVLILIDGVPINRPDLRSVDLSTLPIQNVDHIEVLRGPFCAIYGSGALGGTINIVTKTTPRTTITSRIGSFGESSNTVSVGGSTGGLSYLVEGILTGSTGVTPDTDYGNATVMAKLHWATSDDTGWTLILDRLWHVVGTPGSLPVTSQDLLARTWEGRTLVDLAWQHVQRDGTGTLFRLYTLDDDVAYAPPGTAYGSDDTAHVWGGQAQIVLAPLLGTLLTFGADYQGQTVSHTDSVPAPFGYADADLGLYAQVDWQVASHVLLSLGVRNDTFQLYGTQADPRLGIVVTVTDRLSLRATSGRTFRTPSFDDLEPSLGGNPNLLPETAWSYDAGFDYALAPRVAVHVDGYYTDATNLITSVLTSPTTSTEMNVGHASIAGGSIEVVGHLSDQWFLRANYTNQDARNTTTGLDVIYVPRQLGNLEVTYTPALGCHINVILSYVGDRVSDAANTQLLPGYWLTSITITQTLGHGFALQAGVANLFGVPYQSTLGYAEPGTTYFLGTTKSF